MSCITKPKLVSYNIRNGKIENTKTLGYKSEFPEACSECKSDLRQGKKGISKNGVYYKSAYCPICNKQYTIHYNTYNQKPLRDYFEPFNDQYSVHGVDVEVFFEYFGSDPYAGFFDTW